MKPGGVRRVAVRRRRSGIRTPDLAPGASVVLRIAVRPTPAGAAIEGRRGRQRPTRRSGSHSSSGGSPLRADVGPRPRMSRSLSGGPQCWRASASVSRTRSAGERVQRSSTSDTTCPPWRSTVASISRRRRHRSVRRARPGDRTIARPERRDAHVRRTEPIPMTQLLENAPRGGRALSAQHSHQAFTTGPKGANPQRRRRCVHARRHRLRGPCSGVARPDIGEPSGGLGRPTGSRVASPRGRASQRNASGCRTRRRSTSAIGATWRTGSGRSTASWDANQADLSAAGLRGGGAAHVSTAEGGTHRPSLSRTRIGAP